MNQKEVANRRSAIIHVRLKSALRELIDADAQSQEVTPSFVIRRILADHYEKKLVRR